MSLSSLGRGLILILFLVAIIFIGMIFFDIGLFGPSPELEMLSEREITEYEGESLSSVLDFRENSIRGPQNIDIDTYQLEIEGLVETPRNFTYEAVLATFPHYGKVITLYCVEGWDVTIFWEGVLLSELLDSVNVRPEANTAIFYAYDGYSTSLPLDYILDRDILLAHRMNNVTIPAERGYPFVLVAEEKWGYKWIKWVTRIELSDDPGYRGYWEQRGYSQNADIAENFFA
jgi:DMSO/TMAO reductase YedYZ molybdopterin-dependent catalytic subunit